MLQGMRADFDEVDRISSRSGSMASRGERDPRHQSRRHRHRRPLFAATMKWLKTSGIISPNKWGNLPGGETFTAPEHVDGIFVIDGVVGDYLCEKYGDLGANAADHRDRETAA